MTESTGKIQRRTFNDIATQVLTEAENEIKRDLERMRSRQVYYKAEKQPDETKAASDKCDALLDSLGIIAMLKTQAATRVF